MSAVRIIALVAVGCIALAVAAFLLRPRRDVVVIGEEMAEALEADRRHAKARGTGDSPLPAEEYDPSRGELSQLNPSPAPLDSALATVVRRYAASDAAGRQKMRDAIDMDGFYTLRTFAQRAAVFGLRQRSTAHLRDGLAAVAMIDPARIDPRDIPDGVALLHHAAVRIGADAPALLREAGALAEPRVAELLTGFAARPAAEKDLRQTWMLEEVQTTAGPGFVRRGIDAYEPTADLLGAALQIAELVASDAYQSSDPEVASMLPPVWLRSGDARAVQRALDAARAGVSLSPWMRPGVHPRHEEQNLLIFLVETANEQDAQALQDAAGQARSRDGGRLSVAHGRLFCLFVGRSFVTEVESYETDERLARFAAPLGAILRRHAAAAPRP